MPMSAEGRRIWKENIDHAEKLVAFANAHPGDDLGDAYHIEIDPEDFLDLINGKWDA